MPETIVISNSTIKGKAGAVGATPSEATIIAMGQSALKAGTAKYSVKNESGYKNAQHLFGYFAPSIWLKSSNFYLDLTSKELSAIKIKLRDKT